MLKVGKLININVLDHLVISEESYTSFADEGIIEELKSSGLFEIVEREKAELKEWQLRMEKQRGEHEKAEVIAKKMKKEGYDEKVIKKLTGLRLGEIREL
ncbi:hypothetical protein GCM10011340_32080 [Roseivirga thermotolerans]|uniref:RadC-like JAB domain-containing protein n=1 Tax=Roseivirga thermotolerans TaxID=1758176 RepID=A0ABQ3I8D4_9BACT|nr:hypothetical protein GCM10011340_32080 [Roseivirga thermotolerans]